MELTAESGHGCGRCPPSFLRTPSTSPVHGTNNVTIEVSSQLSGPMDNRPRLFLTAAFLCGVLLTLGFKDFYPDLERRFRRRRVPINLVSGAGLDIDDRIDLEDRTRESSAKEYRDVEVAEGIAACVGNTPLFRVKSLSEETGCDILAKAEVEYAVYRSDNMHCSCLMHLQFLNGAGGSPKDRVALNMIKTVMILLAFQECL